MEYVLAVLNEYLPEISKWIDYQTAEKLKAYSGDDKDLANHFHYMLGMNLRAEFLQYDMPVYMAFLNAGLYLEEHMCILMLMYLRKLLQEGKLVIPKPEDEPTE